MEFHYLKATRATTRRQFTFYHYVSRNSWYIFDWPQRDERLSRFQRHPVILNTGPLNWESSTLTTMPLLHIQVELPYLITLLFLVPSAVAVVVVMFLQHDSFGIHAECNSQKFEGISASFLMLWKLCYIA